MTASDEPIRQLERELAETSHEAEFWYSFAHDLLSTLVHSLGTAAAQQYVKEACEAARHDFPTHELTREAVALLLVEAQRLSDVYAAWGSFTERRAGLERGEPERTRVGQ